VSFDSGSSDRTRNSSSKKSAFRIHVQVRAQPTGRDSGRSEPGFGPDVGLLVAKRICVEMAATTTLRISQKIGQPRV
jgi:hypothetical protein